MFINTGICIISFTQLPRCADTNSIILTHSLNTILIMLPWTYYYQTNKILTNEIRCIFARVSALALFCSYCSFHFFFPSLLLRRPLINVLSSIDTENRNCEPLAHHTNYCKNKQGIFKPISILDSTSKYLHALQPYLFLIFPDSSFLPSYSTFLFIKQILLWLCFHCIFLYFLGSNFFKGGM